PRCSATAPPVSPTFTGSSPGPPPSPSSATMALPSSSARSAPPRTPTPTAPAGRAPRPATTRPSSTGPRGSQRAPRRALPRTPSALQGSDGLIPRRIRGYPDQAEEIRSEIIERHRLGLADGIRESVVEFGPIPRLWPAALIGQAEGDELSA